VEHGAGGLLAEELLLALVKATVGDVVVAPARVIPLESLLLLVVRIIGLVAWEDFHFAETVEVLQSHLQISTHWIAAPPDVMVFIVRFTV